MKTILLVIFIVSAALFMSGCDQYWYCKNASFDQTKEDYQRCQKQMLMYSDITSASLGYEDRFIKNCMCAKGYQLVSEDELPLCVKRKDPDVVNWQYQGVAGKLH